MKQRLGVVTVVESISVHNPDDATGVDNGAAANRDEPSHGFFLVQQIAGADLNLALRLICEQEFGQRRGFFAPVIQVLKNIALPIAGCWRQSAPSSEAACRPLAPCFVLASSLPLLQLVTCRFDNPVEFSQPPASRGVGRPHLQQFVAFEVRISKLRCG